VPAVEHVPVEVNGSRFIEKFTYCALLFNVSSV
jgi:hypothetical protein